MRPLFAVLLAVAVLSVAAPAANAAPAFNVGGESCELLAIPTAAPFATGSCGGVRPGALVEVPDGFCTMNFAFKGPHGARYIGTAGHCVLGENQNGERVFTRSDGPPAKDAEGNRIGKFAYRNLQTNGNEDFALIRLKKGLEPNPQMCNFGGPTGINDDSSGAQTLNYYGNGLAIGEVLPARTFYTTSLQNKRRVIANGVATPGDSGGPVTTSDGRALGLLVAVGYTIGGIGSNDPEVGTIFIPRVGPQLDRAARKLDTKLKLLKAPRR